jgi:hypothetical protein
MKPQVVSSRWTLLLKMLLPMFWICFFGAMSIAVLVMDIEVKDPFTPFSARLMVISFTISTIGLFYLLFMRTKWVALDETHIYVSNFFQVYRYTYDSISAIEETRVLWWRRITIEFHAPTAYGKSIFFISSHYWAYFLEKNPDVMQQIAASTASSK